MYLIAMMSRYKRISKTTLFETQDFITCQKIFNGPTLKKLFAYNFKICLQQLGLD